MTQTTSFNGRLSSLVASGIVAIAAATTSITSTMAQEGASTVVGGTAVWGISAYLNSPNFGRPNPLPEAYGAPARFDEESRLSSWGEASGTVNADGSATLSFSGTSVNYTSTSGAWLRLAELEVELDPAGNGIITAEVSYGMADGEYDAEQAPIAGPERVTIVELGGNDIAPTIADGTASWDGLTGTWSTAFSEFAAGWAYASTITNDAEDRAPAPLTITVELSE